MRSRNENPIYTTRHSFPKGKKPFHVPLYGGIVYFCTSREDYAQVYDYMTNSRDGQEFADSCLGCVSSLSAPDGAAAYLVGVFDTDLNTFVHELGHLAIDVLDRAGCPIDSRTSEAFCYLIGTLAGQFEPQWLKFREAFNKEQAKEAAKEARAAKKAAKKADDEEDMPVESEPVAPSKPSKPKGAARGNR